MYYKAHRLGSRSGSLLESSVFCYHSLNMSICLTTCLNQSEKGNAFRCRQLSSSYLTRTSASFLVLCRSIFDDGSLTVILSGTLSWSLRQPK